MSNRDNKRQKPNQLSDQDRALFRQFCESVTPLKANNKYDPPSHLAHSKAKGRTKHPPTIHPMHIKPRNPSDNREQTDTHYNHYEMDMLKPVTPDAILQYIHPHLHRNLHRQMKKGKMVIEATLDLHHCTTDEALIKTDRFLQKCLDSKVRWTLIIHGKGNLSQSRFPVLKSVLNQWLRAQPAVLAFHSAHPKDGGTGALYVLLKLNKG